ncbi:hypothetical protein IHE77_21010 [Serratia ureilytica]|uniref:hypothetical protein n=1 Tax=Serratia ureilytica TaxID=300181 RepID=UPI001F4C7DCC|nr:hypothetical protein [Serratia ureilytica]UNE43280.1 hypothetical protein IHE77_21010 [Serratia ureilytica]
MMAQPDKRLLPATPCGLCITLYPDGARAQVMYQDQHQPAEKILPTVDPESLPNRLHVSRLLRKLQTGHIEYRIAEKVTGLVNILRPNHCRQKPVHFLHRKR